MQGFRSDGRIVVRRADKAKTNGPADTAEGEPRQGMIEDKAIIDKTSEGIEACSHSNSDSSREQAAMSGIGSSTADDDSAASEPKHEGKCQHCSQISLAALGSQGDSKIAKQLHLLSFSGPFMETQVGQNLESGPQPQCLLTLKSQPLTQTDRGALASKAGSELGQPCRQPSLVESWVFRHVPGTQRLFKLAGRYSPVSKAQEYLAETEWAFKDSLAQPKQLASLRQSSGKLKDEEFPRMPIEAIGSQLPDQAQIENPSCSSHILEEGQSQCDREITCITNKLPRQTKPKSTDHWLDGDIRTVPPNASAGSKRKATSTARSNNENRPIAKDAKTDHDGRWSSKRDGPRPNILPASRFQVFFGHACKVNSPFGCKIVEGIACKAEPAQ